MKVAPEDRINHKWGEEDQYMISSCLICGILKKRSANSTVTLRHKGNKWMTTYSLKGSKWFENVPPCKEVQNETNKTTKK